MLQTLLSSLLPKASNDPDVTRRIELRRVSDRCVCVMFGRNFPVQNWSFGGALIHADERMFGIGQDVDMIFKFKLRSTIIDIHVNGQVVRKSSGQLGIRFEPLNQTIRRLFQQVVDDQVAWEFADSQA